MSISSDSPDSDFYTGAMSLLDSAGIPFMVGGAFALRAYTGVVRDTKDFDLMLLARDVAPALAAFREKGYRAEIAFSHWLAKVHLGDAFLDIIFSSGNGLCTVDEEWFKNARQVSVFGREVLVCPAEEIIWQKAFIMERERFDGGDIAHLLLFCAPTLDWERLLRRFDGASRVLLAHLLLFGFIYPSQRDAIPADVLARLNARLAEEPAGTEKICFGPILSRAQYLPDIEQWGYRDARTLPHCAMTAEQIDAWTAAIEQNAFH